MKDKAASQPGKPNLRDLSHTMPGYRINEYLLVVSPPESLREKILQVRTTFNERYRESAPVFGKPQITLASFAQYQLMEERLINRLNVIAMGHPPVRITLKDFGSFPSHSIYINVTSKLPVQNIVRAIRSEAQQLMKLNDDNKPHFIMEPYINIATKLQPLQYEKGWLEYCNLGFSGRFIADAMLLLKRAIGESQYKIAARFEFKNLPVSTTQGKLFA